MTLNFSAIRVEGLRDSALACDMRLDLKTNTVEYLNSTVEPWKVTLVDTGEKTLTGGRLRRSRITSATKPFV